MLKNTANMQVFEAQQIYLFFFFNCFKQYIYSIHVINNQEIRIHLRKKEDLFFIVFILKHTLFLGMTQLLDISSS